MPGMKIPLSQLELKPKGEIDSALESVFVFGIETAGPFFVEQIGRCNVENVGVLCLDSTHKISGYSIAAIGRPDEVANPIPQIIRAALLSNASYVIIAHNHPSGICAITEPDISLTRRIAAAADLFDIKLIDSIIVTPDGSIASIREYLGEKNDGQ